jgi:hypothetical protein
MKCSSAAPLSHAFGCGITLACQPWYGRLPRFQADARTALAIITAIAAAPAIVSFTFVMIFLHLS